MKKKIYFITGNESKARYFAEMMDMDIGQKHIELDEIQSMSLREIVQKKVREAYRIVQAPVIVEDVSLEFEELGKLPGPFIKFFVDNMKLQNICNLIKGGNRKAVARCCVGYFNGEEEKYFEGELEGEIANKPRGDGGFGWDKIFIPGGYDGCTRAELSANDDTTTYKQLKSIERVKTFLRDI